MVVGYLKQEYERYVDPPSISLTHKGLQVQSVWASPEAYHSEFEQFTWLQPTDSEFLVLVKIYSHLAHRI